MYAPVVIGHTRVRVAGVEQQAHRERQNVYKEEFVDEPSSQRTNFGNLTKNDADDEVAVRSGLLGLIELQQEPGELICHVGCLPPRTMRFLQRRCW